MSNKHSGIGGDSTQVFNVGHGNLVRTCRVVAILDASGLAMRRLRESALGSGRLLDATAGRKTRSIVVTDSDHVILSALAPHTLHERFSSVHPLLSQGEIEIRDGQLVS